MTKLRNQLFLGSALLTSAILLIAAGVINYQVVQQARAQVQAEVGTLLPLYDALLDEHARQLRSLGAALASSPIIKLVLGDARAARDANTLREMLADAGQESAERVELFIITDGAGQIVLSEAAGKPLTSLSALPAAQQVSETQRQTESFALIEGNLFQLVLTPVLLDAGVAETRNTLAVIGTGAQLDAAFANELKQRTHSEVAFFAQHQLFAASLPPAAAAALTPQLAASSFAQASPTQPVEIHHAGESYLAFARPMNDAQGQPIGQLVVLRSFTNTRQFFSAVSNRLLGLGAASLLAAWLFAYLWAERLTRPLETLTQRVRAFGAGADEAPVPTTAQGEIGQLARAFEQMRQSLKQTQAALLKSERLATIGQMSSTIIHDLRNPLATITTAAEVLANEGLAPARRQGLVENQLRAAQRMSDMLRELLEFSQGTYRLNCQRQTLAALVQRVAQEVQPRLQRAGIVLETDVPAELWLEADAERLRRVFENLLNNAAQALPASGGQIVVCARATDGARLRIEVIDNGPGVPDAIRERLFEPFTSFGKTGGTGLGLAIARGIVTAHHGQIGLVSANQAEAASGAPAGARFFIELPACAAPSTAAAT